MRKRRPIKFRGSLVDPEAIAVLDPRIDPKTVTMLTRCLLELHGPVHRSDYWEAGVLDGPVRQLQEDIERISEVLSPYLFPDLHKRRQEAERSAVPTEKGWEKKPIPRELRKAVFERDGFRCLRCGGQFELCADHIHPECKGGPTTLDNLQTLCRSCNSRKSSKVENANGTGRA